MTKLGLAGKLIAVNLIIIAVAVLLTGFLHTTMLRDYVFSHKESELLAAAEQINSVAMEYMQGSIDEQAMNYVLDTVDQLVDARISLVDLEGRILGGSRGLAAGRRDSATSEDLHNLQKGETVVQTRKHPRFDQRMLSVGVPLTDGNETDGEVLAALFLHSPVTGIQATVDRLRTFTIWAGAAALLLAGLLGYASFRRITNPIAAMTEVAQEMADGNFHKRVSVQSEDELGRLGRSLNHLAAGLGQNIRTLRREKDKFASTVNAMSEGVLGIGEDGQVFLVNPAAAGLLEQGLRVDISRAGNYRNMVLPDQLHELIESTLEHGKKYCDTVRFGEDLICDVHTAPVGGDSHDSFWGCVLLMRDVSDERKLEQMRRQFVADASHELRTPLTVISGFLEALYDGTIPEDEADGYVALMREEAERLNQLVENLLDLERYDSGRIQLNFEKFDVVKLLEQVAAKMKITAFEGELELNIEHSESPVNVYADRQAVEQILMNLVDNAVRYTPSGGKVRLRATTAKEKVRLSVSDNGRGIPQEDIPQLWERFYKVDRSRSRDSSGTGLGLAIVKRLIEALGEDIWVKSSSGAGTTFTFTLSTDCC